MEIEVGEYVRTKDGYIRKIYKIEQCEICNENLYINIETIKTIHFTNSYHIKDIAKHSKNIIDLIETGDYVNGHKVVSEQWGEDDNNLYFEIEGGFNKAQFIGEKDIKTILTHEQFKQNTYRLEGK